MPIESAFLGTGHLGNHYLGRIVGGSWTFKVNGVAAADIAKVCGVAKASIAKVSGVPYTP